MKRRFTGISGLLAALVFLTSSPTKAALTVTAAETGGGVVFTFSGSLNPGTPSDTDTFTTETNFDPSDGVIEAWQVIASVNAFPLEGTVPFGTGGMKLDEGVGSGTNIAILSDLLYLNDSYTAGDPINSTLTFAGETFASLGVGSRVLPYIWRIAETGDTLRMVFPAEIAARQAQLQKQIRKLKKKRRVAKKKGKKSAARKLSKKIRRLTIELQGLG